MVINDASQLTDAEVADIAKSTDWRQSRDWSFDEVKALNGSLIRLGASPGGAIYCRTCGMANEDVLSLAENGVDLVGAALLFKPPRIDFYSTKQTASPRRPSEIQELHSQGVNLRVLYAREAVVRAPQPSFGYLLDHKSFNSSLAVAVLAEQSVPAREDLLLRALSHEATPLESLDAVLKMIFVDYDPDTASAITHARYHLLNRILITLSQRPELSASCLDTVREWLEERAEAEKDNRSALIELLSCQSVIQSLIQEQPFEKKVARRLAP